MGWTLPPEGFLEKGPMNEGSMQPTRKKKKACRGRSRTAPTPASTRRSSSFRQSWHCRVFQQPRLNPLGDFFNRPLKGGWGSNATGEGACPLWRQQPSSESNPFAPVWRQDERRQTGGPLPMRWSPGTTDRRSADGAGRENDPAEYAGTPPRPFGPPPLSCVTPWVSYIAA